MNSQINIKELAEKVEAMVEKCREYGSSQYHVITLNEDTDNEERVTIRVADHLANPSRVDGRVILFIIEEVESEVMHQKKNFKSIAGAIYLDSDNCDESGYSIEELLDRELN